MFCMSTSRSPNAETIISEILSGIRENDHGPTKRRQIASQIFHAYIVIQTTYKTVFRFSQEIERRLQNDFSQGYRADIC